MVNKDGSSMKVDAHWTTVWGKAGQQLAHRPRSFLDAATRADAEVNGDVRANETIATGRRHERRSAAQHCAAPDGRWSADERPRVSASRSGSAGS